MGGNGIGLVLSVYAGLLAQTGIEVIAALTALLGGGASVLGELVRHHVEKRKKPETIEDRVKQLTASLRQATELIGHMEAEISTRSSLAEKLKADVETYRNLEELHASEVESVRRVLRLELQEEGTRSFWKGVAVNFGFFVLGVLVSIGMSVLDR